jgi:hypothetical protein
MTHWISPDVAHQYFVEVQDAFGTKQSFFNCDTSRNELSQNPLNKKAGYLDHRSVYMGYNNSPNKLAPAAKFSHHRASYRSCLLQTIGHRSRKAQASQRNPEKWRIMAFLNPGNCVPRFPSQMSPCCTAQCPPGKPPT